jgi:hypothetical protein
MQFKTLAFLAALIPAALADFKVFCGERCVAFDAGGCGVSCIFMNNPASCADVDNSVNFHTSSDVSGCGGVRCEGCDRALPPSEWDITQLEINNKQTCTPSQEYWGGMEDPHFSKGF